MGRVAEDPVSRAEVDRLVEDMREYGYSAEAIAQAEATWRARAEDPVFRVHPDNVTVVRLFHALQTQWRMVPLSTFGAAKVIRTGLEYGAVETTARLEGLVLADGDFRALREMEAEALLAWSEAKS